MPIVIFYVNGHVGHLFEVGNLQIQRPVNGAGNGQPARLRGSCRLRKGLGAIAGEKPNGS